MGYRCFDLEITDGVAHVVLNRPEKRNSMIPEFWDELPALVRDIDENSRARAIVISSTGPHFTSGLDVKVIILNNNFLGMVRQWQELFYSRRYSEVGMKYFPDFVKIVGSRRFTVASRSREWR